MALTPNYLQKCSEGIERIFWQLGTTILVDIAERIKAAGGMTSTTEYLNQKLRQMGLQQAKINELVAVAMNTERSEVDKLVRDSTYKSTRQMFENLEAAGYDTSGLEFGQQILKTTNVLNNELTNLTRTTARLSQNTLANTYDQAYLQVASGAYSFDQAVANACEKLAREGIGMVEYPTGAHRTIEAAVRVAVRTSVNQNALQCEMDTIQKLGVNLVETSSHLGARPSHAVWQGKIFWLNTPDPRYENFYEATGYGTGEGLGGYNCRHSFYAYFEELGEKTYEHFDEEKNAEYYQQEQAQRNYERKLREWDRREQILKAGGQDTTEARKWKRYYKGKLAELVKNSNGFLKRDYAAEKGYVATGSKKTPPALPKPKPEGPTPPGPQISPETPVKQIASPTALDLTKYKADNANTSQFIFTNERRKHIQERHPEAYDFINDNLVDILLDPELIYSETDDDTMRWVVKEIDGHNVRVLVKMSVGEQNESLQNSVISGQYIPQARIDKAERKGRVVKVYQKPKKD